MRALPSGTVTFLFTDVEGSTRLLHELGAERYSESLAEHRRTVRQACAREGGVEVDTQGDAFFMAFSEADGAARAADAIGTGLGSGSVRVRIGLHTGRPLLSEEGYVGEDVHLGARIAAAGHGGQVLISRATRDAIGEAAVILDLGEHRLKDIPRRVPIYQLGEGTFPPLKTISNTNLPRPADSFIGRERELADVVQRIRSRNRLLTLAGPGGTGKTRLAIEAAASILTDFKAGVFWIDLAPVRDPDAVATAVAAALTTEQDLVAHIGEREMLLVLDNIEHVIDAAPWVGSLVRQCPNLSVLVTSRERMRVRGESLVEVPPLAETESARLFVERADLPRSADVEELCARLEHLPLAIELAAARATSLTPRQILDRLGKRLDLFEGGRDADPRQRTLRATIDWSHDLLNGNERRLLRRMSVFAGGTTLDSIEAVCEGNIDTIESLIDKSLVRFADGRYSMLETVREYAAGHLDASGERPHARGRHAEWIQDLMSAHVEELAAGGADELGKTLAHELGNLQAAFAWHVDGGDAAAATHLLDTVWWFLGEFLSQNRTGVAMCDAILAMPGLSDADRVIARHREGNFAVQLTERQRAREAWTDAAALANRLGDSTREAHALGNLALITEDPAESVGLFERSMALAPPVDERDGHRTNWNLAGLKLRAGDADGATAIYVDILGWAKRVGDYQYIAAGEREVGERALERGDAVQAFERATHSRDLAARRGHMLALVVAEFLRCTAAVRLGRYDDAVQSLADACVHMRQGDLEADEDITAGALLASAELLAGIGETDMARRVEAARRRVTAGKPAYPESERAHQAWLETNGVIPMTGAVDDDVGVSLATIRIWLRDRNSERNG